jgi:hypothetical protein
MGKTRFVYLIVSRVNSHNPAWHKKIAAIVQRGLNDDGDCGDPIGETEAESGG